MARKTIEVEQIKQKCNKALSDPETLEVQANSYEPDAAEAYRWGIIAVLETVLMDSGNYKGFRYVEGVGGDESKRVYS